MPQPNDGTDWYPNAVADELAGQPHEVGDGWLSVFIVVLIVLGFVIAYLAG